MDEPDDLITIAEMAALAKKKMGHPVFRFVPVRNAIQSCAKDVYNGGMAATHSDVLVRPGYDEDEYEVYIRVGTIKGKARRH